jgi:hypothetical protein
MFVAERMKSLSRRTRLALVVLVAAGLGGLAAGLVLTQSGGSEHALAAGHPGVVAQGHFTSLEWPTKGRATIVRTADGHLVLEFGKGFSTQEAPELNLYLATWVGGKHGSMWKKLTALQRYSGTQRYDLPVSVSKNLHIAVMVFCETCRKPWGVARLAPIGQSVA